MKMILAGMFTVLVGLTVAGSSYAAEQPPGEILVAMASFKSVCGGNTGRACPGDASVAPPAVPPTVPAPSVSAPAPASPAVVTPAPAPPGFDFSLTNGGTVTMPQVSTAVTMITASLLSGAAQQIALSASGFPSGVTASFSQGTCGPTCFSTLNLTTSSSAPAGNYPITVKAASGSLSHSTTFTLKVTALPPVTATPVPSPAPVPAPAPVAATPATAPVPAGPPAPSPTPAATSTPTPAVPPSSTSVLVKADRVQVAKGSIALNVRDAVNGNVLGQQPELAVGTVTGSPQTSGGMNWVYVDYDSGVDGWSTDRFLVKVGAGTSPASTSFSSPTSPIAPTVTTTPSPVASTLQATYLGVTGEDKVGQMNQTTANGKADFHISVSGLRSTPSKVTVTSNTGGVWETPFNGANWIIGTQYNGSSGDFWFEQYGSNSFRVKVKYADGTTEEVDASNNVASSQAVAPPVQTLPTPTLAPTPTVTPNRPPAPSSVSGGNIYYVSSGVPYDNSGNPTTVMTGPIGPTGNDNNPGTLAQPFKTLKYALSRMAGGDTLILRGGEYDTSMGTAQGEGNLQIYGVFAVPSGASWNNPTTLLAYSGERPVFRKYIATTACCSNTTDENLLRSGVHLATLAECTVWWDQHPEYQPFSSRRSFPSDCWTGSGSAGDGLYWQANYGYLGGPVVDFYNINYPAQYIIFDGIDIDARGIVTNPLGFSDFSEHIKFQNLEIRYGIGSCISQGTSQAMTTHDFDLQFINTKIHTCGVPFDTNTVNGVLARETPNAKFWHGWYLHAGGASFINSESYGHAGTGLGPDGNDIVVKNSYIHDNSNVGLYISGGNNWTIQNNVFYNNKGGSGIYCFGTGHSTFINNTVIAGPNNSPGYGGILIHKWCGANTFENNIVDGFNYGLYNITEQTTSNIFRNNLLRTNPAGVGRELYESGATTPTIKSGNILNQDPLFVNRAAGDFHLQAGSPAIDKGYPNGLTTDFTGNPRPWGATIDIGAYEYGN